MNMNEKKIIEGMARVLCERTAECSECDLPFTPYCVYKSFCEKLYKAGYRKKVADDEIIIKKTAYEQFEQAKQETAREILKWMDEPFTDKEIRKLITEKYGIE